MVILGGEKEISQELIVTELAVILECGVAVIQMSSRKYGTLYMPLEGRGEKNKVLIDGLKCLF